MKYHCYFGVLCFNIAHILYTDRLKHYILCHHQNQKEGSMKNEYGGDQQNISDRLTVLVFQQVTFPVHVY